jgi:hypothetical protein
MTLDRIVLQANHRRISARSLAATYSYYRRGKKTAVDKIRILRGKRRGAKRESFSVSDFSLVDLLVMATLDFGGILCAVCILICDGDRIVLIEREMLALY